MLKNILITSILAIVSCTAMAQEFDAKSFAQQYYDAFKHSQMPNATKKDIEQYTSLLTDDAVWQHLPYAKSDRRLPGGKKKIETDMLRWLGAHKSYTMKLLDVHYSNHFIVLETLSHARIQASDESQSTTRVKHYLHILEIENNKVAIVRIYDLNESAKS